jgi:hypothetical protein
MDPDDDHDNSIPVVVNVVVDICVMQNLSNWFVQRQPFVTVGGHSQMSSSSCTHECIGCQGRNGK